MRVSTLVRSGLVAGMVALGVVACSENTMGPSGTSAQSAVAQRVAEMGTADRSTRSLPDSGQANFWLYPTYGTTLSLGDHQLSIPANAVCEPSTSHYGVEYWDQPCTAAAKPIRMTVTWRIKDGQPRIDFSPDLRFVPTADPSQWVVLSMKVNRSMQDLSSYNIYWWYGNKWVDESKADPTLLPYQDRIGNRVARRLKHLSGYTATTEFTGGDGSGYGMY